MQKDRNIQNVDTGHKDIITDIAFNFDGNKMASASTE